MASDHYQTLKIERSANKQAIKAAFRRLAKQHHPDRNPSDTGAPARFREIVAAYSVLVDEAKRAAYDALTDDARRAARDVAHRGQAGTASQPRYEPVPSGGRIQRAIEVLGRLRQMGGYETWSREVHGWAFLRAQDEVYELQSALRGKPIPGGYPSRDHDGMIAQLERFKSEMAKWRSNKVLMALDGVDEIDDYKDRSRVTFITNPDVVATKSRIEAGRDDYVPGVNPYSHDVQCASRASVTFGKRTHLALVPALIRITDLQSDLDVLMICAAFAKRQWNGCWTLNGADDPEFLFRAAVAAEIAGVKTMGYEIPAERRSEADWIKRKASRLLTYRGERDSAGELAEARLYSLAQRNWQLFEMPNKWPLQDTVQVLRHRELAGPLERVKRVFCKRPQRCRYSSFSLDIGI